MVFGRAQAEEAQGRPCARRRQLQRPLGLADRPPPLVPRLGGRALLQQAQRRHRPDPLPGGQGEGGPQGAHRVQRCTQAAGQSAREAAGSPGVPLPAHQLLVVRLKGQLPLAKQRVDQLKPRLPQAAGSARKNQPVLREPPTLHEQVLEGRVGAVVLAPGQRHRHGVRQRHAHRHFPGVAQGDGPDQRAVLRAEGRRQLRRNAPQPRLGGDEPRLQSGMGGRAAEDRALAGVGVRHMQAGRIRPVQQIAGKPGGVHAEATIVKRAVAGPQGRRAAAGEHVGLRRKSILPCDARAPGPRSVPIRRTVWLCLSGTHALGHPLLQQQRQPPRPGQGHEVPPQGVPGQRVAEGAENHALVVGHVALHQRKFAAGALGVRGLVKAPRAPPAQSGHPLQVFHRRLRRDHRRQRRGIGGDHAALALAAQGQLLEPEGPVLVIQRRVQGAVARFGHAPGPVAPPSLGDLRRHRRARAVAQQGVFRRVHQDQRQKVFKHRAAPGEGRDAAGGHGAGPPQPPPVPRRHLTQGHGDVARQPRLRGDQVVAGLAQAARLPVQADEEKLLVRVV